MSLSCTVENAIVYHDETAALKIPPILTMDVDDSRHRTMCFCFCGEGRWVYLLVVGHGSGGRPSIGIWHPFHVRVRVDIVPIQLREVAHSTKYFALGQREIFYFVRNFGLIT